MKGISFLILLFLVISCATEKKSANPIHDTVMRKHYIFRQCYQESDSYKGRHVNETGIMEVGFHISKEGKASDTKIVKSDFKDPNFSSCVMTTIKELSFPPSDSELEVIEPITFGQSEE